MYILAVAWLYVVLLMAVTEKSIPAGVLTFLFYGLLPALLYFWLAGARMRRRTRLRQTAERELGQPNRSDAKPD